MAPLRSSAAPGTCLRCERRSLAADRELLKGRPKTEDQGNLGAVDRAAPRRRAAAMAPAWSRPAGARISGRRREARPPPRSGSRKREPRAARSRPFRLDRLGDRGAAARHCARRAARPPCAGIRRAARSGDRLPLQRRARCCGTIIAAELADRRRCRQHSRRRAARAAARRPSAPAEGDAPQAGSAGAAADARSAQRERARCARRFCIASMRSTCPGARLDRCRPQPRHLSRELAAALGARIRRAPRRKPALRLDHRARPPPAA